MNYYEKIIQEKKNDSQVVERGTIKGVEYFIEKITETVKYPRPFEQVRYVGKVKKDGRVVNYTPRHERLDTCKRAVEDLAQDYIHNSKGETKMGYYEDLIKQKQEKRNFRADPLGFGPTVVGVGTPDDYKAKFKVGDKVKFYSGEGVIVKGPIKMRFSLTPTYHIKVTTGKEAGREVSRYEEELKKNSKDNSKEEKDNADSAYVEASQKAERIINRMFQSRDKKEAKRFLEKIGWETRTLGEDPADYARAIRRAVRNYPEKSAEILSNEKEEKENESPQSATARRKALQKLEDAQKKANWWGDTTMQKLKHDLTYADEENLLDVVGVLERYLPKFEAKVKSFGNEKEEKENESKSQIEKRIKDAEERIKLFQRLEKEVQAKLEEGDEDDESRLRRQRESYRDGIINNQSLIDHLKKELKTAKNEKEEKGYYAKLAEEKQERKNYKFTDKEIADYLKSNPSSAKQYVRKKTAGKAENITIHPETLTAELEENGKIHVFKFVSDESLGFILKYMGTK